MKLRWWQKRCILSCPQPLQSSMESLPSLLYQRSTGSSRSVEFRDEIAMRKSQLELLNNPRIASPHQGAIPALQVDRIEGRFLLSGSFDSTICVYDLSKWGTDFYLRGKPSSSVVDGANSVYQPVARSVRVPLGDELEIPHGHSHSVVEVSWYPVDTGAFISASADGAVFVWDTHAMKPVIRWKPLPSISCMNLSTSQGRSESLLALGSVDDSFVRLVDIRSGASSHSLVGHDEGVTSLHWSPRSDVIVATGSLDGTIRLWDIRKSGSRSCVTVLDRDQPFDATKRRPFRYSYSHLANDPHKTEASPNNYQKTKSRGIVSHGGSISALLFTADGSRLVSTGTEGKLQVWDLMGSGHLLPLNFSCRPNQPAVHRNRTRLPMIIRDSGSKDTTVWVGHGSKILGYNLEKGGLPSQVLEGHMHVVASLERVDHSMQVFSGGTDGMILAWGCTPQTSKGRKRSERCGGGNDDGDQRKRIRDTRDRDRDSW